MCMFVCMRVRVYQIHIHKHTNMPLASGNVERFVSLQAPGLIRTHTCMHIYINILIFFWLQVMLKDLCHSKRPDSYVHIHACMHACIYVHIYINILIFFWLQVMLKDLGDSKRLDSYVYMHTCMHTYIHIYIHT
jgi:hypothetical protein